MAKKELCTLSIIVQDIPGVLSQVARLFSRKGYNIHSITSGACDVPQTTRMTIVIEGDRKTGEQIAAQCRKLIPVLSVKILEDDSVRRECTLVKLQTKNRMERDEIIQMANIFHSKIIDVGPDTLVLALLGDEDKTTAFLNMLQEFTILEGVRTGAVALDRGNHSIYDNKKLKEEYNYGKNVLREGL